MDLWVDPQKYNSVKPKIKRKSHDATNGIANQANLEELLPSRKRIKTEKGEALKETLSYHKKNKETSLQERKLRKELSDAQKDAIEKQKKMNKKRNEALSSVDPETVSQNRRERPSSSSSSSSSNLPKESAPPESEMIKGYIGGTGGNNTNRFITIKGKRRYYCKTPDCWKYPVGGGGMCLAHGGRYVRLAKSRLCKEDGCHNRPVGKGGRCKMHGGVGRYCKENGCMKYPVGPGGRCITHGGGRYCKEEGCIKFPVGAGGRCLAHGGSKTPQTPRTLQWRNGRYVTRKTITNKKETSSRQDSQQQEISDEKGQEILDQLKLAK